MIEEEIIDDSETRNLLPESSGSLNMRAPDGRGSENVSCSWTYLMNSAKSEIFSFSYSLD